MRNKKYYPTFKELLASSYGGAAYTNLFSSIHWFDGTLTYVDSYGQTQNYPDLGFKPADLIQTWDMLYENLRIGFSCDCINPFNGPSAAEWTACSANFLAKGQAALKLMENKYLGLVKTYGLKYDPINNYDMVEEEGTANKTTKHSSTNTIVGGTITEVDAPAHQVNNYTTTYDDASTGRLAGYSTTDYYGTHRVESDTNIPIIRTKQTVENEGDGSSLVSEYTGEVNMNFGEIDIPSGHNAAARKLTRHGNIGTTTTQEMINAERELAKQQIIDEFFKEFNSYVMLAEWKWS